MSRNVWAVTAYGTDVATDIAERPAMLELHRTYGKTIHTW